tara:strand:- start:4726 stop:4920 length:195 start_codon:yes stop_codon:yes gene_type:complete
MDLEERLRSTVTLASLERVVSILAEVPISSTEIPMGVGVKPLNLPQLGIHIHSVYKSISKATLA